MTFGSRNPDDVFYVIRRPPPGAGLFSNYHWALGHVAYALEKGYRPVVDMENYPTSVNEGHEIQGTRNAWEYYFRQPSGVSLAEAYQSRNVILARMESLVDRVPIRVRSPEENAGLYKTLSSYLQFNSATEEFVLQSRRTFFGSRSKIMGVLFRGTDYKFARGHARQPELEACISKVEECSQSWEAEWIFLVTEVHEAVDRFREKLGDRLVVTDSVRVANYRQEMGLLPALDDRRPDGKYLTALEYLRDIALLSECETLVGGMVNGTLAAMAMNNNRYTHHYIFELGENA